MVEREGLKKVMDACEPAEPFGTSSPPRAAHQGDPLDDAADADTLCSALKSCVGDFSDGVLFDRLWRLLMALRHWHGGSDQHWIKNASACRRASGTMNWFKRLGKFIFILNVFCFTFISLQNEDPNLAFQRGSTESGAA